MPDYTLRIIIEGEDKASKPVGDVNRSLSDMLAVAGGNLIAGALKGIAEAIINLGKSAIESYANLQALQVGLEGLMAREISMQGLSDGMYEIAAGTMAISDALPIAQDKAKQMLDELTKIALVSPYEMETVASTYKMAMAFGFTSSQAKDFTTAILNVASGVGAGSEQMGRMSYNLAQIRMQGKVTAMDVRQLAMAGFDLNGVLKYMGEQVGHTISGYEEFNELLEDGTISWEQFTELFSKYADENFGGASARMAKTLQGLKSTFSDVFNLTIPKIIAPAMDKITELLNTALSGILTIINAGVFEKMGEKFGASTAKILDPLILFAQKVNDIISIMTGSGVSLATAVSMVFGSESGNAIRKIANIIQTVGDTFKWVNDRVSDFSKFLRETLWDKAKESTMGIWGKWKDWLVIASPYLEKIGAYLQTAYEAIKEFFSVFQSEHGSFSEFFSRILDVLDPLITMIADTLLNAILLILQLLTGDFAGAWESLKTIVMGVFTGITNFLLGFVQWILEEWFGVSWLTVTQAWDNFWLSIQTTVSNIVDGGIKGILLGLVDWVIGAFFGTTWTDVKARWVLEWNNLKLIVDEKMGLIRDFINQTKDKIAEYIGNILNTLANFKLAVQGVWDKIQEFYNWLTTHVFSLNFSVNTPSLGGIAGIGGGGTGTKTGGKGGGWGTGEYPGLAKGGIARGLNIVGEEGAELAYFGQDARIISNQEILDSLKNNGGSNQYNITIYAKDATIDEKKLIDILNKETQKRNWYAS